MSVKTHPAHSGTRRVAVHVGRVSAPHASGSHAPAHHSPSHHTPAASSTGRKAKLVMSEAGNYMTGEVKGEHFHVHDSFSNHVSHVGLTGTRPNYKPIPLTQIHKAGHKVEYLD